MAVINILDQQTAELIAAGEVVEKPASVVKELVENSIDAGAKNIIVDIECGGIKKILVQDDGCGIDSEYVKTAFIRHATSKISSKNDLDSISSLGFRGEALASIARVSRLSLTTKTSQQDFGVEICLVGGVEDSFAVKPFIDGSRFIIKDLFFNTPARMKFLKKDFTEAGYIQDILVNLALSRSDISFTFKKDNKEIFSTIGDGSLLNTVASIFDTELANQFVEVNFNESKYSVLGYTSKPEFSKQSRNMQFVFINGRFIKNKTIIAAVENAYKGTVMTGKFPAYIININMPYDVVDVNVHPAKTEVRFSNEKEVFSAVYKAIKIALSENTSVKELAFTQRNDKPSFFIDAQNIHQEKIEEHILESSFKNDGLSSIGKLNINITPKEDKETYIFSDNFQDTDILKSNENIIPYTTKNNWKDTRTITIEVEDKFQKVPVDTCFESNENTVNSNIDIFDIKIIGEIFKTYILCESKDGILVIDKHAAHERLLYENLKANKNTDNQMLLSPVTLKLSAQEKEALMENLNLLTENGFIIEDFGVNGVLVRAIPINITSQDPQSLVAEIAYNLSCHNISEISEKLEWIFHSVACRSAIKAGDKSTMQELVELVKAIKCEKIPLFCPHGRPVIITITKKELEKQFGRL